jgi:3-hydroxybutyryl-CoA dehydrogenase
MNKKIEKIAVVGIGFMGIQISSRASLFGYRVKAYDANPEAPVRALADLEKVYKLLGLEKEVRKLIAAQEKIMYCIDLSQTVTDADLIIEAVSEDLNLKREIFTQIDSASLPHSIMASNSSSFPVLKIENAVRRRDKLINIHFDAPMLQGPLVDIMPGSQTTAETIEKAKSWVESIECIPVIVRKPIMGYLGNRLWREVKREALMLWSNGYGEFRDIDRSWMLQFRVDVGPFAMMDVVGLDVIYAIEMAYYSETGDPRDKPPQALKEMVERGDLGLKTGRGFYDWSNPEFLKPDFLKKG